MLVTDSSLRALTRATRAPRKAATAIPARITLSRLKSPLPRPSQSAPHRASRAPARAAGAHQPGLGHSRRMAQNPPQPQAEPAADAAQGDSHAGAAGRTGGNAKSERIGQGIAQYALQGHAGHGQRAAAKCRQGRPAPDGSAPLPGVGRRPPERRPGPGSRPARGKPHSRPAGTAPGRQASGREHSQSAASPARARQRDRAGAAGKGHLCAYHMGLCGQKKPLPYLEEARISSA